jgi:hypothetical protein
MLEATLDGARLEISTSLPALADRDALSDGLRHVVEIGLEVRAPGVPSTLLFRWRRRCAVTYSSWTERYTLEASSGATTLPRDERATFDEVVAACRDLHRVDVGDGSGLDAVDVTLTATLDAPSPDAVHRLRRWVADPDATGAWVPSYLGVFVQVFLNRIVLYPAVEVTLVSHATRERS